MADDHGQGRGGSDKLMQALDQLKRLESERRSHDSSSPAFHDLADRVERQARTVMDLAVQPKGDGSETLRADAAPDDADLEKNAPA